MRPMRVGPVEAAVTAVILAAGWVITSEGSSRGLQAAATPTFNHDVAPILFASCVGCHRPNEVAPMSLLTYQDARPWARAIKAKVLAREMPPWPADPQFGRFRNENRLTDAQIATVAAWVDRGAPEGDGVPPRAPQVIEGWMSRMDRPPDQVVDAPVEFELPASGQIPVVRVWTKQPIGKERFIEAIELLPTNRAAVHHASVFRAKLPRGAHVGKGELWPGGPAADGVAILRNGAPLSLSPAPESFGMPLIFYVPSGGFLRFPEGIAKRIDADDYFLWTFHLTTNGRAQRAGARLGLWFSRSDTHHEMITWTVTDKVIVDGKDVPRDSGGPVIPDIPPGERRFTVTGIMPVNEPITLYALWPHMHARGHDMTFLVQDSRGRERTLLSVPRYQFDWQFTYELAEPLKISAGSTIKAIAHYDNSPENRYNPDPSQRVIWGPQADNEMFDPFLELVYDRRTLQQVPFIEFRHPE